MVYVSLRQNRPEALDGNPSGVAWQAEAPPWHLPTQDQAAFRAKLGSLRSKPNPGLDRSNQRGVPDRSFAWRVAIQSAPEPKAEPRLPRLNFDRAVTESWPSPEPPAETEPTSTPSPAPPVGIRSGRPPCRASAQLDRPLRKRVMLLLGLAYLFLAALASGLAWHGYLLSAAPSERPRRDPERGHEGRAPDDGREGGVMGGQGRLRGSGGFLSGPGLGGDGGGTDTEDDAAPDYESLTLPPEPFDPSKVVHTPDETARDPHTPGFHTAPDGTQYLNIPLRAAALAAVQSVPAASDLMRAGAAWGRLLAGGAA